MATIVNNPQPASSDNGVGFLLGVLVLIVFVMLFLVYGVPYLMSYLRGPQINIPSRVNVNVHTSGK